MSYRIADRILPHSRLSSIISERLLLNSISSCFEILGSKSIGVTSLTFLCHVTTRNHLIPHRPFSIGVPLEPSLSLTVSEIFSGECDTMVDMTVNDL